MNAESQKKAVVFRYLWDFLIHHYHYLGLPTLVGEHLKQAATIDGQIAACIGWASAAWKGGQRDAFIGWAPGMRRKNLHLVVNNVRFFIPEWVRIPHLASKVLSLSLAGLSQQWHNRCGHRLALAETFVDSAKFTGAAAAKKSFLPRSPMRCQMPESGFVIGESGQAQRVGQLESLPKKTVQVDEGRYPVVGKQTDWSPLTLYRRS